MYLLVTINDPDYLGLNPVRLLRLFEGIDPLYAPQVVSS